MSSSTQKGIEPVVYKACFAAGTLVHTDKGMVPIEKVRVGTRVLSQPELSGERDYRRVTNRIATLDQIVFVVQVKPERSDAPLMTLITTHGHPFWVESPAQNPSSDTNDLAQNKAKHWVAAEQLTVGQILQLADGSRAQVHATGMVRKTQHANIGFVASQEAATGIVLSLPTEPHALNEPILPASAERLDALENSGPLQLAEPLKVTVYNLTVDEFHTYYVADLGVWVHNTYGAEEAITRQSKVEALKAVCFKYNTKVFGKSLHGHSHKDRDWVEIDQIRPGDPVLSWCEKTGEFAYKKVIKTYESFSTDMFTIHYDIDREDRKWGIENIGTTGDHPFWVEGKGWTKVRDLQQNDLFLTYDDRWAKVDAVVAYEYDPDFEDGHSVCNIEVEDFNTYFVSPHGILVHNCNEDINNDITVKALDPNLNETTTFRSAPGSRHNANELSVQATLDRVWFTTVAFLDVINPLEFNIINHI